ncbi:two-component sensor histidine kinase [Kribbella speibonae]|uniref:histidine kinase n=2 Tax=Kribbella speibonae TaxID=1572660 RepID=A0A4R0JJI0_9ACTN|nr:two-component sensor histidine kinase [Kribbella speibonae]TCC41945.1 two-component sensor histidine kinase [Kribbella speibonae]
MTLLMMSTRPIAPMRRRVTGSAGTTVGRAVVVDIGPLPRVVRTGPANCRKACRRIAGSTDPVLRAGAESSGRNRPYPDDMRWPRWVALGTFLLVLMLVAGSSWLLVAYRTGPHTLRNFIALAAIGTAIAALGLAVTRRQPANPVGAILGWIGAIAVFLTARDVYYNAVAHDPGRLPLDSRVVAWLEETGWWLLAAVAFLLLYFPTGHLVSRRWRPVPPALLVLGALQNVPLSGALGVVSEVAFFGFLALCLTAVVPAVIRYRGSTGTVRAQLKWLLLAGLAAVVYPLVCLAEILVTGRSGIVATVFGIVTLVSLPASVAVAMLRHDLYDVDRVLADTVSYSIVMVVLLGTYAVAAVSLGLVLGRDSAVVAAAATAVCALILAPLRSRLQRAVDRRLYPPRRAALLAIEDLQRRIHTEQAQPEDLESALRGALRDPALRVGLLIPGASGFVDAAGDPVAEPRLVPVLLGGEQIGVLASEATPPAVLKAVAAAAASLVEVTRLRAELAGALREVAASRARLVQAGDEERRRLERDLHDGAQQRLVALGMALRLAQRHLDDGTVDVNGLLDQGVAELGTAVAELRQIAHGLRPTSLDDGLHAALSAITQSLPIPVRLQIPADLPEELATTAYFVAAEAVTNAAKYANATAIVVRVARSADVMRVRIEDDGCGGAVPRPGSGLSGLLDRVAAVGGALELRSPAGRGTTVEAVLPCES